MAAPEVKVTGPTQLSLCVKVVGVTVRCVCTWCVFVGCLYVGCVWWCVCGVCGRGVCLSVCVRGVVQCVCGVYVYIVCTGDVCAYMLVLWYVCGV